MTSLGRKIQQRGLRISFLLVLRKALLAWFGFLQRVSPGYHLRRLFVGHATVMVNGFKMHLDLRNDVGLSRDLYLFRKREHLSTDYMLAGGVVNPGDTVLDVGANMGYYALIESRLVGPEGRVFAIEPVENNFRVLKENIALNGVTNIVPFRLAAGRENGTADIHVANKGNVSSFIYDDTITYVKKETVEVVTIDDFVAEHGITPALIRMDVQGFEKDIVAGMPQTLAKRPKLFIEVHPFLMSTEELIGMFTAIADSGYDTAVVMKTRKAYWMRRDGEVRPSLRYLTEKIEPSGYTIGIGSVDTMPLSELQASLNDRKGGFIVFLS